MVWIPFLVSSAIAIFFPSSSPEGNRGNGRQSSSSSRLSKTAAKHERNLQLSSRGSFPVFTLGLVAGTGLGVYMTIIIRRYRVREQLRRLYKNWVIREAIRNAMGEEAEDDLENDTSSKNPNKLLKIETSNIQILRSDNDLNGSFQQHGRKRIREFFDASGSGSTVQLVASPDTCLTTSMHASLLTITPHTKTKARASNGAELYIVVQGKGEFTINGEETRHEISSKDIIVINPWSVRSIENMGRENLILVRVTDEEQKDKDAEGFDSSKHFSTNEAVTKALNNVLNTGINAFDSIFHGTQQPLSNNDNDNEKCIKSSSPRSVVDPGYEI